MASLPLSIGREVGPEIKGKTEHIQKKEGQAQYFIRSWRKFWNASILMPISRWTFFYVKCICHSRLCHIQVGNIRI